MKRPIVAATAVLALLAAGATTARSQAQPRFTRLDVRGQHPAVVSRYQLADDRPVLATVELADAPMALRRADAKAAGRVVSAAEEASARTSIAAAQSALTPRVASLGGTVLFHLQDAMNAMVVQVKGSQLDALGSLPGVKNVYRAQRRTLDNTVSDLYTGAANAWTNPGTTGKGVKIAIIDTGIDYYHAMFAGSGKASDFAADDGLTIGTAAFPSAKVIAGYDFVGNDYDASSDDPAKQVPHPDPDPLDCNGHGSHVAGTAAGFGVTSAGKTYGGPYNASAIGALAIGPGSAPDAKLMGYRVFGCDGSVDDPVLVAAIDRAVKDGADVINMSLGSPFGDGKGADNVATNNAVKAGVVVVASAGNEGPSGYMTGGPSASDLALSVAAEDAIATFPGATIGLTPALTAINANGSKELPVTGTVHVLTAGGGIALGCDAADYASVKKGEIVVAQRGTCARVDRATFGQAAGAAAVIMVNNAANPGLPPFEGDIAGVHIAFLGVPNTAAAAMLAANGKTITVKAAADLDNPGYAQAATFTSGGPRSGDAAQKPEVMAPGVSVLSTAVGTGSGSERLSGTSMASPHTAGIAADVLAEHPSWSPQMVKAAIMNTANATAAKVLNYDTRRSGSGTVDAVRAASTSALAWTDDGMHSLSFGYRPSAKGISVSKSFKITNTSSAAVTYDLATQFAGDPLGATVKVTPATVTVAAGATVSLTAKLSISAAATAALPKADQAPGAIVTVAGAVVATPRGAGAGRFPLRVPFIVAPRGLSDVIVAKGASPRADTYETTVINNGTHAGTADVYAWQLSDPMDTKSSSVDVRAVGIQALPGEVFGMDPSDRGIILAVNTFGRWSNGAANEVDVVIDTTGDGKPDVVVFAADLGLVLAGTANGQLASFVVDLATGALVDAWLGDAPMNGSTLLIPFVASDIARTEGNGKFSYAVVSFDGLTGARDAVSGVAAFNAYHPPVSTGDFLELAPGASQTVKLVSRPDVLASLPAKGWLVVTMDDANGAAQAEQVAIPKP